MPFRSIPRAIQSPSASSHPHISPLRRYTMASWDEFDEDSVGVASIDDNFEEASLGGDEIAISGDVFVAEDPVADGDVRKRERSFCLVSGYLSHNCSAYFRMIKMMMKAETTVEMMMMTTTTKRLKLN